MPQGSWSTNHLERGEGSCEGIPWPSGFARRDWLSNIPRVDWFTSIAWVSRFTRGYCLTKIPSASRFARGRPRKSAILDLGWLFLTFKLPLSKHLQQNLHFVVWFVQHLSSSTFQVFFGFFCDFLPRITLNDLRTIFLKKLTLRASFWRIICILLINFEMWPFWPFSWFLIFDDLFWP